MSTHHILLNNKEKKRVEPEHWIFIFYNSDICILQIEKNEPCSAAILLENALLHVRLKRTEHTRAPHNTAFVLAIWVIDEIRKNWGNM